MVCRPGVGYPCFSSPYPYKTLMFAGQGGVGVTCVTSGAGLWGVAVTYRPENHEAYSPTG